MNAPSQTSLCKESTTSLLRMIFLALILVSPTFLFGLNLSYTTVALPKLKLSISDASWFASLAIYASPISTLIVGFLIDRYGRKTTLVYSVMPSIIGWSLLYWNRNVFVLLLGQVFNGLTMGAGFYPVQVYAGECIMVNNVRLRNIFMTWISLSSSLGTTCMLLMANFFEYHEICAVAVTLCVCFFVTFYITIPESPTWLYRKGRIGDAEWSQKKLGIMQPILKDTAHASNVGGEAEKPQQAFSLAGQIKILTRPDVYKPILILSVASTVLSFCGTTTMTSYMINIIDNTIPGVKSNNTPTTLVANATTNMTIEDSPLLKSYNYSLIGGIFMCLGSLLSMLVLPYMGMKKMFIASKVFITIGLLTLTYSTVVKPETNVTLRIAAVTLMSFLMGLELGPRMSFAGDIFPVDAKGFACIPSLTGSIATGTANKIYPYLRVAFGGYAYLFYALASVFGIFFIHFFLPEVVGRTLDEINKDFKKEED